MFELRDYQERSLDVLVESLSAVADRGADLPFCEITRRAYVPAPRLPGLPCVCLRGAMMTAERRSWRRTRRRRSWGPMRR
jgi:hypothetical protein